MTDKKAMSVNESLAEVNEVLTNSPHFLPVNALHIAACILADIAGKQQEVTDAYRKRVESVECMLNQLLSDSAECSTAKELLQAVDELSAIQVSGEDHARAQELYFFVQNKVRLLIAENDVLRNAAKHEESNLTVTSNRIAMNGSINITHGTTVDNTCSNQNGVERKKMGCIRIEDNSGVSVMPVESIVKIKQPKHSKNITEIMLSSGETDIYEVPIDEVLKAFKLGRTGQAEFKQATAGTIVYKGDMKNATLISTVREE